MKLSGMTIQMVGIDQHVHVVLFLILLTVVHGEGGHSLVMGYWGCAAGWGRIFMARLTIMGSPFQAFSIELLEWCHTFSGP